LIFIFVIVFALSSCASPTPTPTEMTSPTPTETALMPTQTSIPEEKPTATPIHTGAWSEAPSMLNAHSAHAVAVSESAIYALAGTNEKGKPILDVEAFDGSEWKVETTLPGIGLNAPTASVVDQKLYVMGGFLAVGSSPTDENKIYDLVTRTWSIGAPLPNPRGGHAAVVLNGRVHLFGGGNSERTLADHSEYNPATDTWRDLAPLPRSEGSPAAVAVDGKIYVIGGRSGYSDFGDVYIYDPATDAWTNGPAIEPRGTSGAVFYCGGIYLFGGESQHLRKNLDEVLRLDLDRGVWESAQALPTARKFVRAVLFMDAVYIVGGSEVLANSHSPIGSASVIRFVQDGCP
jgi:N-acetylneuraminic acid mutarotase